MLLPIVVIKRVPTSWLRMSSVFAIGRTQHLLPSVPASSPRFWFWFWHCQSLAFVGDITVVSSFCSLVHFLFTSLPYSS
ncbi:hypothetical protein AAC387_Pa06g0317 [Persea americana]